MSARETDSDNANFGDGESENATFRDRMEADINTSHQSAQQEGSAQGAFEQVEFEEYESEEYDSDEYRDSDDDDIGRGNVRDARPPTYCPICLKTTELSKCQGCDDMAYCSKACQRKDWPVHKFLCRQLTVFQATERREYHFRAILFPANDAGARECLLGAEAPKPEFVWCMKGDYRPFFPPDGFSEAHVYSQDPMGRCQRVSTQSLLMLNPSIMGDKPRNSCIEAIVGNRLLMKPWPLSGWRGNLLIVGCTGDVTMRDFRAIVDYFQCYPRNHGIVDPSRYIGHALVGVMTVPEPHIIDPSVEAEVQEVHLTEAMRSYKEETPMRFLEGLLPVDVLHHYDNTPLGMMSGSVVNHNRFSLLLRVNSSLNRLGKVMLPIHPLPYGTLIYLRRDGKPLLKHHYEALSAFVYRQTIQAAGAQGLSKREMIAGDYEATRESLEKLLTKDKFREFWAGCCKSKRLEATPCPLDM